MEPKRWKRLGAAAAASTLLLTSCGGDAEGDAGGGEEQVYVQAVGNLPQLNPQFFVSPAVRIVGATMFEPLVKFTDEYELVPWLAQDWEISDDGLEITFHLQEGVEWHDGEPFTSEDVAFNLEEVIEYQYIASDAAASIGSVETPDEHTVVVHFDEPYGPFMETLTLQYMVPKHLYEGTDFLTNEANSEPVGTGPFIIDKFDESTGAEVVANEDYWAGDVKIDRAIFPVFTDANARDLEFLGGELDSAGVEATSINEVEADPNLEMTTDGAMPWQVFFNFNTDVEELSDPEVRKAIYSAIDREQIVETAVPHNSEVPHSIYAPGMDWPESPNVDLQEDFPRDLDAINQALDDAGHPAGPDGTRFTIDVHYMSALGDARAIAEVMQSNLEEVGINLDLQGIDSTVFMDKIYSERDFDTALVIGTTETDPNLGITIWHECNEEGVQGRNPSGLCDEEVDQLAENAMRAVGEEDRGAYLQEYEERVVDLMVSAPIVHMYGISGYNTTRWQGQDAFREAIPGHWHELEPVE